MVECKECYRFSILSGLRQFVSVVLEDRDMNEN